MQEKTTEKDLIIALKTGSEQAFNELYKLHWNRVYHFTSLYLRRQDEVREVVQEIFIKVWENREKIDENTNFTGYLFIITRNHIFNKTRDSLNKAFLKETLINATMDSYMIDDEIAAEDLKNYIDQLIEQMPAQRQRVFNLSRKEYKTYKEISSLLDISEKTVERHINEAIKFLKSNLHLYIIFLFLT